MGDTQKKILMDLIIGLAIALAGVVLLDVLNAQTLRDVFRLLSDCFFLAAALLLATSGLTWAKNGGAWDGLGFTFKTLFARMMPDYDSRRVTFAQYKEKREEKSASPIPALVAGAVYLVLAIVFLVLFNVIQ